MCVCVSGLGIIQHWIEHAIEISINLLNLNWGSIQDVELQLKFEYNKIELQWIAKKFI